MGGALPVAGPTRLHVGVVGVASSESALEEVYLSQISRGD